MSQNSGGRDENVLPMWLNIVIVLTLLFFLGYALIVIGERGLSFAYIFGGLLGTYLGLEKVVRAWRGGGGKE